MDLEDLEAKYKGKPTRLATIKKNTRKITCPIGECDLYEDMIFKSTSSVKQTDATVRARSSEVRDKVKKARKTRKDDGPKSEDTDKAAKKGITSAQKETAKKWATDLVALADDIKDLLTSIDLPCAKPWKTVLPAWVQEKATEGEMKMREVSAMVELMAESPDNARSFADDKTTVAQAKKEAKEHVRRTTLQIQEAKLVIGFKDEAPDEKPIEGEGEKKKGKAKAK